MATGESSRSRAARSAAGEAALDPALPQKKRARHRLVGAIALSLVALALLPFVLESEPVRSGGDIAILIPPQHAAELGAKPQVAPAAPAVLVTPPVEPTGEPAGAAAGGGPAGAPTSAPTQPAQAAAGAQAPSSRFLLQVGAFATEASAKQALDRVQAQGLAGFTERIRTERGDRIRVRVGPFPSREAAERARERLKAAGMDAAMIAP
jgi:DedD protein